MRVSNDCLVTVESTKLNMGPDMNKSLCAEEEQGINLEGSQWYWRGDPNGLMTYKLNLSA